MSTTSDPTDPDLGVIDGVGMQKTYLVLPEAEDPEFVRPVRRSYKHLECGAITTMGQAIAETYARNPYFYGATYCVACRGHFPVGEDGQFVWVESGRNPSKVGT